MTAPFFKNLDLATFWDDSDYARKEYVSAPPDDALIRELELELGYRLPASYIWLMKQQNGGIPHHLNFPTGEPTSWAEDHIAITGIMGIGREKANSLGGDFGSRFWIEEWQYPDIGIAICDCPSAGHDMVFLDYRECGPEGEPAVVHVDQEDDYRVTWLADNFENFICGLVNDEVYDTSAEDKQADLEMARHGAFSATLADLCSRADRVPNIEQAIREVARQIIEDKGFFALHADERSYLLYDIQFWLYANAHPQVTQADYLKAYPDIIAFGGQFTTGGYAPAFIEDWLKARIDRGDIDVQNGTLSLTAQAKAALMEKVNAAIAG
ncbi:SMI1/KNR4 family protein [Superficieibacter sp. HKU1]|uniref:SMI1/KNR4 family protein n=1 Tax=Superficieibacter sp. HKU1 TaxID=3031919 RepID=UPI0023E33194|nr:SMI1/KNR4 family protein [Superficieibacter sp. HKU1]WES69962.1 SMI1/KNR4 family protein [Superficieibacter sp. HKU1]